MCLCRSETALFCRNHIRFAVVVRDYTVFHEDSSVVIPQEFLKFLKNPQNSLKFYVWLLVRRVVL